MAKCTYEIDPALCAETRIELDPYWTEKGKQIIYMSISVFEKFDIQQSDEKTTLAFTVDGSVFGKELQPYVFYVMPGNSKTGWNVQCCPRGSKSYVFGFMLYKEDGEHKAYVYHNAHGVKDYGLEVMH